MTRKMKEQLPGERLYVVVAKLLLALPKEDDPETALDLLNMMLIPLQRRERDDNAALIDYTFSSEPVRMSIPAGGYDYERGFSMTTPQGISVINTSYIYEQQAPRSADELDAEYNKEGDGEHPIHTRAEWRNDVAQENTSLGYWQWLADLLEIEEAAQ